MIRTWLAAVCSSVGFFVPGSQKIEQSSTLAPLPLAEAQILGDGAVPDGLTACEWASIREAYEAGRDAVYPVDDGYRARNPGQQWETHFDERGFTTVPEAGGWSWGLELQSYGFPGAERTVEGEACVSTAGSRVVYAWDATLEEWYVNERRGLEHGYTVRERPRQATGTDEALTFSLTVRGGLRPELMEDLRGVRFVDEDGGTVLTYAGLAVFDAGGKNLPAGFRRTVDGLQFVVDECGAKYPITIDPLAQQAYFKASNSGGGDFFGNAVSVSSDTVVVGAPQEDSNATGVNGDQSNNSASGSGAAYVFVRSGTTWAQQAYLKASNTDASDFFGLPISIAGDTIVVGAPQEDSNATGVNGDQSNNSASGSGAAYVFVRSGTTWAQQAYLKASNTGANDSFGKVSIVGDTIVVGSTGEDSGATGVNGDQNDNSAINSGAAYVFARSGTTWSQQAYLKASNPSGDPLGFGDGFGSTVSVSGDTVVVGAPDEDSDSTGVNGDQNDDSFNSGAVYVFMRSGATWSQQAYLKASNTDGLDPFLEHSGDHFGAGQYHVREVVAHPASTKAGQRWLSRCPRMNFLSSWS